MQLLSPGSSLPASAASRASGHAGRLVHSVQGEHHTVYVYDDGDARYLSFSKHEQRVQTRVGRAIGNTVLDPWMASLAAIVAAHPRARRVLVLGVGGGALPMALRRIMPAARIDAVDHDEAVLQVAQAFFGLTAGDGLQLHASDARAFVQRSSSEAARRYDAIVLDVFDDDYIPAPLMTMEFLHEMRRILAPRGVLAANTFGPEPLMRREYATYAAVYGDLRVVTVGWNRLLVVGEAAASVARNLERGELHGAQALSTLGFESSRLARCVEHVSVCPSDAPICDAEVGSHALQAWRKRAVARPASIGWSGMAAALLDARVRAHTRSAGDGLA